jgi:hypothetical protein
MARLSAKSKGGSEQGRERKGREPSSSCFFSCGVATHASSLHHVSLCLTNSLFYSPQQFHYDHKTSSTASGYQKYCSIYPANQQNSRLQVSAPLTTRVGYESDLGFLILLPLLLIAFDSHPRNQCFCSVSTSQFLPCPPNPCEHSPKPPC